MFLVVFPGVPKFPMFCVVFCTCLHVMPRSGATRHVPRGHDRHMANLAKGANFVEATVPTDSMQRKDFDVFFASSFRSFPSGSFPSLLACYQLSQRPQWPDTTPGFSTI